MTRTTNARLAGFVFLFYIAVGITQLTLFGGVTSGEGPAAKLANLAQHATEMRINLVLGLITCFSALTLGVALYALTREQDLDLAMLALCCRVGEGLIGGISIMITMGLLSLATATGTSTPDPAAAQSIATFVLSARSWSPNLAATFFAVGSTLFSWLFLRGRMIPIPLAWLGVLGSILLVIVLPMQLAGFLRGPMVMYMWIPIAIFEVVLALWLIVKGVAVGTNRASV